MEMAATNLVDASERVVVVGTGYFSDRMAEMLRRRGAEVDKLRQSLRDGSVEIDIALGRLLDYGDAHPEGMLPAPDIIPVVATN